MALARAGRMKLIIGRTISTPACYRAHPLRASVSPWLSDWIYDPPTTQPTRPAGQPHPLR